MSTNSHSTFSGVARASDTPAAYFNMPFAIVLSCMLLVPS